MAGTVIGGEFELRFCAKSVAAGGKNNGQLPGLPVAGISHRNEARGAMPGGITFSSGCFHPVCHPPA